MSRRTGFPPGVRELVSARSRDICEVQHLCHGDQATEIHHRRGRGMGSTRRPETNQAANALHLCSSDHLFITDYPGFALKKGWTVRQSHSPLTTPLLYRDGSWRILDNEGHTYTIQTPLGDLA